MTPAHFPEANTKLGPPPGLDESHVQSVPALVGNVRGGPHDGATLVTVAWKPNEQDLAALNAGGLVYLFCIGGLPAHYLDTHFSGEIHPR